MINSLLDCVLDRTVIGGYTNIGYRIRSRGWPAAELPPLGGRVVMVTGATSGLGLAAAEGFARLGATVWLVARSQERGERARAAITERSADHDVHGLIAGALHDHGARPLSAIFAAGDQPHGRAEPREGLRGREPEPRGGTGDHHDPAAQRREL